LVIGEGNNEISVGFVQMHVNITGNISAFALTSH